MEQLVSWLLDEPYLPGFFPPYSSDEACVPPLACADPARALLLSIVFHSVVFTLAVLLLRLTWFPKCLGSQAMGASYITSTIHVCVVAPSALYFLLNSFETSKILNVPGVNMLSCWSGGYFAVDLAVTIFFWNVDKDFQSMAIVWHHIVGGSMMIIAPSYKVSWMICVVLTMEWSNPFISFTWFLQRLNLETHPIYKINGAITILMFFTVRILFCSVYFWITMYLLTDEIASEIPIVGRVLTYLSNMFALSLNVTWMCVMLHRAYVMVFKKEAVKKML